MYPRMQPSSSVAGDYFFSFIRLRDYVNTEAHLLIMVCVDDAVRGYLDDLLLFLLLLLLSRHVVGKDVFLACRHRPVLFSRVSDTVGRVIRNLGGVRPAGQAGSAALGSSFLL